MEFGQFSKSYGYSAGYSKDDLSLTIFYCQAIVDNGSDTSYQLTRSSPVHTCINHQAG